jgi:hypothetical protein
LDFLVVRPGNILALLQFSAWQFYNEYSIDLTLPDLKLQNRAENLPGLFSARPSARHAGVPASIVRGTASPCQSTAGRPHPINRRGSTIHLVLFVTQLTNPREPA